jgi:SAM-dependent methyltransferase
MKPEEYEKMYAAEQTYFWFVAKQRTIRRILSRFIEQNSPAILDLGCGTGTNLDSLGRFGEAYGIDESDLALGFCQRRGLGLLAQGRAERLPFCENCFDLVCALDLLEHLADDDAALGQAFRVLKPGGILLVTVPAYPSLFGAHDHALGHKRRYKKADLGFKVKRSGFSLIKTSHYMSLLFPATLLIKLYQKRFGSRTETIRYHVHPLLNRFFLFLCELEARLLVYLDMPVGTSILLIARKPVSGL